jgi:hypothetical protein
MALVRWSIAAGTLPADVVGQRVQFAQGPLEHPPCRRRGRGFPVDQQLSQFDVARGPPQDQLPQRAGESSRRLGKGGGFGHGETDSAPFPRDWESLAQHEEAANANDGPCLTQPQGRWIVAMDDPQDSRRTGFPGHGFSAWTTGKGRRLPLRKKFLRNAPGGHTLQEMDPPGRDLPAHHSAGFPPSAEACFPCD